MRAKALRVVDDVVMPEDTSNAIPPVTSATALYAGEIKTLKMFLVSLLWAGLTMLVARPKAGKSWFTLQAAVQLAGGPAIAGVEALEIGPVLYAALEEPPSRTMGRLRKIAPPGEWTANLHFVYDLLPLMGGGADQLRVLIQKLHPRVVVLDTFTALVKTGTKSGSDVFRSQYAEVSELRKIAEEFQIAVVVVHHVRKGSSDGVIEAVAGTGGIAAAVDTLWLLKRKPEGEATLDVVGRETEERTLALRFEQSPFGWIVLGDDAAQLLNADRRQLLELLHDEGPMSPAQLAVALSKHQPAVRMLLKRMREAGLVKKQGSKYIPTHTMSYAVTECIERDTP